MDPDNYYKYLRDINSSILDYLENRRPHLSKHQTRPTCYNCGMNGHISRNCLQKKIEKEEGEISNNIANSFAFS